MRLFLYRLKLNFWPCIRGTGAWVTYISPDYHRLEAKLPLSWRTYNLVGTIFGGALYASTDPFYMVMLMKILGPEYVVWDKASAIRFKRPAKKTLYYQFEFTPEQIAQIKSEVQVAGSKDYVFELEHKDKEGVVYTQVQKTLYIATRGHYDQRLAARR